MAKWEKNLPTEMGYYWWRPSKRYTAIIVQIKRGHVHEFDKEGRSPVEEWQCGEWRRIPEVR